MNAAYDSPTNNGTGGSPGAGAWGGGGPLPTITPEVVEKSLAKTNYFTEGLATVCIATMHNGFAIVGTSFAAAEGHYDAEVGKTMALQDAQRQVWPLLNYQLREALWIANQKGEGAAVASSVLKLSSIPGGLAGATQGEVEASRAETGLGAGDNQAQGHGSAAVTQTRETMRA